MKKQWSLFRFCVCSGEKLGFCDMKGVRMRKIILITLAMFLALSSSLNANESTEKSPLLNTSEVNSLLVEHRDFLKEVLDDVLNKNSSKMDKNLKESFWTVINYFQSLENSKSLSYQAVSDLENAIVGFAKYPNIVAKLSQHRTEAINHFLQKVSPNLVNNQEFISILLAGQKEAELSKLWTRRFFKYLNDWYWEKARWYMAKWLIRKTPEFARFFSKNRNLFWNISILVAEEQETLDWKKILAWKRTELVKQKEKTNKSIRFAKISENI